MLFSKKAAIHDVYTHTRYSKRLEEQTMLFNNINNAAIHVYTYTHTFTVSV